MSDEPNPKDLSSGKQPDNWVMPEPTFRSSEGYTLGSPKSEAVTGEMEADGETTIANMERAITQEIPAYDEKKGGGSSSFLIVLGVIALIAALIAAAYYLLFPTPVDTTF